MVSQSNTKVLPSGQVSKSISGITLPPQSVFASREERPASRSKCQSAKNSDEMMNDNRQVIVVTRTMF